MTVDGVERGVRPDEDVAEHRLDEADGRDVPEFPPRPEPLRRRQRLDDGLPHQAPAREEHEVLERMDRVVVQRGVVQVRDVPDIEVHGPDRERDQGMREKAQPLDRAQCQHRPQHLTRQPEHEEERCKVADQHVLRHVQEEEVLFAELVDRRVESEHDQPDAGPEAHLAPRGHRPATPGKRARPPQVQDRGERRREHLERFEAPRTEKRRRLHHLED